MRQWITRRERTKEKKKKCTKSLRIWKITVYFGYVSDCCPRRRRTHIWILDERMNHRRISKMSPNKKVIHHLVLVHVRDFSRIFTMKKKIEWISTAATTDQTECKWFRTESQKKEWKKKLQSFLVIHAMHKNVFSRLFLSLLFSSHSLCWVQTMAYTALICIWLKNNSKIELEIQNVVCITVVCSVHRMSIIACNVFV